jgi:LysM repeat protein
MSLLRSNVEFAKRVFLDRLTTDQQPMVQPRDIDEGPGDEYDYAGVFDPFNFGVGADCSGLCGIMIGAAINGPQGMSWTRLFSTETFYDSDVAQYFKQTTQDDLVNGSYPIKVMIMHGGGGPDSHMACQIDGIDMESNGDYGVCTEEGEITGIASDFWNDWWVYDDGGITEDTTFRQPMSYPLGLDYAGGRCSGAGLVASGVSFVCRYLTDGGEGLPGKQLLALEFVDLVSSGLQVVFNWETTTDFMLGGFSAGVSDAQAALDYIDNTLLPALPPGTIPDGYAPVVYFSCDFDESPDEDAPIEDYLQGAASVLGGIQNVGIYGSYYICTRAQAATGCRYLWQTEAWSGGNVTSAVNIMQRNNAGYMFVDGVECDINEAHTPDFGQFVPADVTPPPPAPAPAPGPAPGQTYTVQSGDSLTSIANQFGISEGALLAANPQVTDPDLIYPGQVLAIPVSPVSLRAPKKEKK